MIIPTFPDWEQIKMWMRPILHPLFHALTDGLSEFTFADIYLFRNRYSYGISRIDDSKFVIRGEKNGKKFFLLPFGLPDKDTLRELFSSLGYLKLASESVIAHLPASGYTIEEDRDNFDYLYLREKLANLDGKKLHKKRNLVNSFVNNYTFHGKTLWSENIPDAIKVLDGWREVRGMIEDDYDATREALNLYEELGLRGSIVYTDGEAAGFTIGEELKAGTSFAIHFEKALEKYKGIYQFMNKCFASILSEKYETINREQDLGDEGLRQAKESYKPIGFVKKYIVHANAAN
jgi:hypothetical protein